eukprot:gene22591-9054_t
MTHKMQQYHSDGNGRDSYIVKSTQKPIQPYQAPERTDNLWSVVRVPSAKGRADQSLVYNFVNHVFTDSEKPKEPRQPHTARIHPTQRHEQFASTS